MVWPPSLDTWIAPPQPERYRMPPLPTNAPSIVPPTAMAMPPLRTEMSVAVPPLETTSAALLLYRLVEVIS